ncbi:MULTISPECIES: hypothetical protein [Pseudomonas]|uniref:Uncharacterized protein n=1 Tax=Pseudomonas luteola TaxID=47886 RepID=A0A2X2CHE5_PSELU|nr:MULTISPECIES: hypothetical protein [Pseudomonas]ENA37268.1 hypothetical protein HMPREF1487_04591 [Pseudomonas sp. HPB0071]MBF8643531.1 hypothetical protein [Pseudomonas zeshuii]RRW41978.1 hypothetical protein EGJ50_21880 [Pseudomonas luteola]SHJ73968.1 hypothetical protein SAMN05216295_12625 [Pseudomonas zeshuii]SPZ08132.1 Uncharacterised protein [Pseudomonas luteola]
MNSRLSTIDADIEEILNAMSAPERIALISKAVLWAASEVGLDGVDIEKSIQEMHHERLHEIAQKFDDRYFELQELDDPEHLTCFSKARGYSAAAFLAQGNIHEAMYEAIAATDAPQDILRIIKITRGGEA